MDGPAKSCTTNRMVGTQKKIMGCLPPINGRRISQPSTGVKGTGWGTPVMFVGFETIITPINYLAGGIPTPLKNHGVSSSVGMMTFHSLF